VVDVRIHPSPPVATPLSPGGVCLQRSCIFSKVKPVDFVIFVTKNKLLSTFKLQMTVKVQMMFLLYKFQLMYLTIQADCQVYIKQNLAVDERAECLLQR